MDILDFGAVKALGITEDACRRYGVPQVRTRFGIKLGHQYSPTCAKVLDTSGSSFWEGDYDPALGLFGQSALSPGGGKVLIVGTEFECLRLASLGFDAICLAQPKQDDPITFSILADSLMMEELLVWDGAVNKQLEKFLLHLAKTGKFTLWSIRDSNEPILTTEPSLIQALVNNARPQDNVGVTEWKPRGIYHIKDVLDGGSFKQPIQGVPTGFPCIDKATRGWRRGEVVMITAGTGVGKSTMTEETAYQLGCVSHIKTGLCYLENPKDRTVMKLASIHFNLPLDKLRAEPSLISKKGWDEVGLLMNDYYAGFADFGSLASDELFSKIEYLIDFEKCEFIILDHISIIVSGMSSKEGERKDIDILMTKLATLAVSRNVGFICISHLSQPDGSPHEEGGRVTLSQLRGSGSIKQLSWTIIAQERNQQDPESTHALVRVLKCRETGKTGAVGVLFYNPVTGRLREDSTWDPVEFEQMLQPRKSGGKQGYGKPQGNNRFVTGGY